MIPVISSFMLLLIGIHFIREYKNKHGNLEKFDSIGISMNHEYEIFVKEDPEYFLDLLSFDFFKAAGGIGVVNLKKQRSNTTEGQKTFFKFEKFPKNSLKNSTVEKGDEKEYIITSRSSSSKSVHYKIGLSSDFSSLVYTVNNGNNKNTPFKLLKINTDTWRILNRSDLCLTITQKNLKAADLGDHLNIKFTRCDKNNALQNFKFNMIKNHSEELLNESENILMQFQNEIAHFYGPQKPKINLSDSETMKYSFDLPNPPDGNNSVMKWNDFFGNGMNVANRPRIAKKDGRVCINIPGHIVRPGDNDYPNTNFFVRKEDNVNNNNNNSNFKNLKEKPEYIDNNENIDDELDSQDVNGRIRGLLKNFISNFKNRERKDTDSELPKFCNKLFEILNKDNRHTCPILKETIPMTEDQPINSLI